MDLDNLSTRVETATSLGASTLVVLVFALLALLVAAAVAWRMLKWRRPPAQLPKPDLRIDVNTLGAAGPPARGAALFFFNVPVRLAAVVVAPAGNVHGLPTAGEMGPVYDSLVPFLSQVIAEHRPLIRRWEPQLSPRGFATAFFANVPLPGEQGKGTPWASAAGVFKVKGRPVMAGLVFRSDADNYLGQTTCETETKWLEILRVQPA